MQDSKHCLLSKVNGMPEQVEDPCWFVLRDLKRANAKSPAYKILPELGFETFTPMHWVLKNNPKGGQSKQYVPFIHGLLFTKAVKSKLDAVIDRTDTLQYRFIKGAQQTPMTVPPIEMERFIKAVTSEPASCIYYSPEDIKPEMLGKQAMIVGGPMDGTVGYLLTKRGSKKKRLMFQIEGLLAASVEITDGFIQLI